jgi:hypothetical protein
MKRYDAIAVLQRHEADLAAFAISPTRLPTAKLRSKIAIAC